jgi:hypothetical protein
MQTTVTLQAVSLLNHKLLIIVVTLMSVGLLFTFHSLFLYITMYIVIHVYHQITQINMI